MHLTRLYAAILLLLLNAAFMAVRHARHHYGLVASTPRFLLVQAVVNLTAAGLVMWGIR